MSAHRIYFLIMFIYLISLTHKHTLSLSILIIGFRDIMINVRYTTMGQHGNPVSFACEVQVTHIDLRQYEIENDTKALQHFFRHLMTGSQVVQDTKLKILERIVAVTSPIINAVATDDESMDSNVTEAITTLSAELNDSTEMDQLYIWVKARELHVQLFLFSFFLSLCFF